MPPANQYQLIVPQLIYHHQVQAVQHQPYLPVPIVVSIPEPIYFESDGFRVFRREIGRGTFATVWAGVNLRTGEPIAAKEVKELDKNEVKCLK